jgi:hypothetical protein
MKPTWKKFAFKCAATLWIAFMLVLIFERLRPARQAAMESPGGILFYVSLTIITIATIWISGEKMRIVRLILGLFLTWAALLS